MSVRTVIDDSPVTGVQILVIGLCFFLNMLDGMDVLAIAFAAPMIADNWSVSPQALGIVFSAALVGMAIGAVFISPYADVIGRRNMILISLVVISIGMIATASAETVLQLVILRLISGLGIGAMLASLTSMVAEYAPERHRDLSIVFLHAGYPVGAVITGFIAAYLLPEYGWQPLFVVAGIISLVSIPLIWFLLPESLEFLVTQQPANALTSANRILGKMAHPPLDELPEKVQLKTPGGGLKELFSLEMRVATLSLWFAFLMSFATLYFLLSWVVKLAVESGLEIEDAMYAGIALNMGAFFGSITLGWLSSKLGLRKIISTFFYLGAVMIVVYGNLETSVGLVLLSIFFLMYFIQGGFTGLYAVAARLYPTPIRTTGVGWAIGAGRIGAIVGPAAAGFILGAGISISWTFVVFAVPAVVAGITVSMISSKDIS